MWHKAIWKGHPMRLELTRVGLLAFFFWLELKYLIIYALATLLTGEWKS